MYGPQRAPILHARDCIEASGPHLAAVKEVKRKKRGVKTAVRQIRCAPLLF